ncbi:N-acetyl-D-glucosamine kinase [Acidisarcina polymorpha]|uniref:N-acetyl-D-glucosamine kinase n=1 Tax=Acidisarcina polymorpha TaxID=2211140 RepID=A0A2Z5FX09_9BACT|nr:ROK family protein [Acidisarcina polymorpha]AXC11302.1 N-acetyl-D-glucosamine kinase [Acidisarcina polymorpha]
MARTIGVVMAERVVTALIEDHKIVGQVHEYPEDAEQFDGLVEVPSEDLCDIICDQIVKLVPEGSHIDAIGVALPGIVRNGIIEDSPNLAQLKGAKICAWIQETLQERGRDYPVNIFNDADAVAAGLAATRGQLDRLIRVWTIGNGIGFGRFPYAEGPWEGGHTVISLDLKENYCGCGGRGHLEGIMGHRAMRLRFMDMEPDEVFAAAKKGDKRCTQFVELWHRALAAATATQIHLEGPGRFYFTGRDISRLDLVLLKEYLWEMVKMSPLQSYTLEVVQENAELAIIGAGEAAAHVRIGDR